MLKTVFVIVGPTASGKTYVSLRVAEKLECEIISADSRQIFKYLDIGTAKPAIADRKQIIHHFIDELYPDEKFTAGDFKKKARNRIEEIFSRGRYPLVVGGSGLYLRALIDGIFDGPSANPEIRAQLEKRLSNEGAKVLLEELRKCDPISAERMHPSNTRRIIRALEVYYITGIPLSEHHQKGKDEAPFKYVIVGLNWERAKLYSRINKRVDWMINKGLLNEVKYLLEMKYTSDCNSLQTVGYQEVFKYFRGELSFNDMVELIKRNTRRFAKRQLTWFRRDERIKWFDIKDEQELDVVAGIIATFFRDSLVFSR